MSADLDLSLIVVEPEPEEERPPLADPGGVIPIVFNDVRLRGTIIWYNEKEDGVADLAVALCEGEIDFVRSIYADGSIFYKRIERDPIPAGDAMSLSLSWRSDWGHWVLTSGSHDAQGILQEANNGSFSLDGAFAEAKNVGTVSVFIPDLPTINRISGGQLLSPSNWAANQDDIQTLEDSLVGQVWIKKEYGDICGYTLIDNNTTGQTFRYNDPTLPPACERVRFTEETGSYTGAPEVTYDPVEYYASLRWYPGDEWQQPDPAIVEIEGDDAPAFHGIAYIVLEDFRVDAIAGSSPDFEVQVVREWPQPYPTNSRPYGQGRLYNFRDIARELLTRQGFDPDDHDLDAGGLNIAGLGIATDISIADIFENVCSLFPMDMGWSGTQFRLRGVRRYPEIVIEEADAAAATNRRATTPISETDIEQTDVLPSGVSVNFVNSLDDYVQDTQTVLRPDISPARMLSINTNVAIEPYTARALAEYALTRTYLERETIKVTVPQKYATLDILDVFTYRKTNGDEPAYRVKRIVEKENGLVDIYGVRNETTRYNGKAAAQAALRSSLTLTIPNYVPVDSTVYGTILYLPALYASHNYAGDYIAIGLSSGTQWGGATLQWSADSTVWQDLFEVTETTITATIETSNFVAPVYSEVVDRISTVDVTFIGGAAPSSITFDELLNNGNLCTIDDEILSFQNVTDNGDGTYTLDTFLRGRFGTEFAIAAHAADDSRLVMLSQGVYPFEVPITYHASLLYLRLVPNDNANATPQVIRYPCNNARLLPWAPVQVIGTWSATPGASDLVITWVRRERVNNGFIQGSDLALLDTPESYEVVIMDGATAVREESASSETYTYSLADQVTDFGSAQSSYNVYVTQVAPNVGAGFTELTTVGA